MALEGGVNYNFSLKPQSCQPTCHMAPKKTFGMPETDENNTALDDALPGFKTLQLVVESSKPQANKRKRDTEAPQPNIFGTLQHMLYP